MDLGWNDILWCNPRETHQRDKWNGCKRQHRETTKHYQTKSYLTSVRYLLFYSIVFLLVCSFTIMFVHWVEFSHLSLPSGVKSHSWDAVTGWRRDYTLALTPTDNSELQFALHECLWNVGMFLVPAEDPRRHRESMQAPHREAPGPVIEHTTFLQGGDTTAPSCRPKT